MKTKKPAPAELKSEKPKQFLLMALILLAGLAAYYPALKGGFIWDDEQYVVDNPVMYHSSWKEVFTTYQGYYHPLSILTYKIEYTFFKLNPRPYHVTSLALHLANCALLFYFFLLLGSLPWAAFFGALLFALHPVHVESVAWIADRKDLLYGLFFLGTLITYLKYLKNSSRIYFVFSVFLFTLSVLSKPFSLTTPLVLFGLDYLLKRELNLRLIIEKIPFGIASALFLAVSTMPKVFSLGNDSFFLEQQQAATTIFQKAAVSGHALLFYLKQFLYPALLYALYPPLKYSGPFLKMYGPSLLVCAATLLLLRQWRTWRKPVFGWLSFLFCIIPAIPLPQLHPADRYLYVPSMALAYLAGEFFSLSFLPERPAFFKASAGVVLAVLFSVLLPYLTWHRCEAWKDSMTLYNDILSHYPDSARILTFRGKTYRQAGNLDKALADYDSAIKIDPNFSDAYVDRAALYIYKAEYDKTIQDSSKALSIDPRTTEALFNRGAAYLLSRNPEKAIPDYNEGLKINPENVKGYLGRGMAYSDTGKYEQAVADFSNALAINPRLFTAYTERAKCYFNMGKFDEALADYSMAIELNPKFAAAYVKRAAILMRKGDRLKAKADAGKARELGALLPPELLPLLK